MEIFDKKSVAKNLSQNGRGVASALPYGWLAAIKLIFELCNGNFFSFSCGHISSSLEKESQVCHLTSSPIPTGEGKLCPPYYYWHPQFFWASTMPAMFMRFSESVTRKADNLSFMFRTICESIKVHIFWEGLKILRNLHLTFFLCSAIQKSGGDFEKFCGLLRIYELYIPQLWVEFDDELSWTFLIWPLFRC